MSANSHASDHILPLHYRCDACGLPIRPFARVCRKALCAVVAMLLAFTLFAAVYLRQFELDVDRHPEFTVGPSLANDSLAVILDREVKEVSTPLTGVRADDDHSDGELASKRRQIREMMHHAWSNYAKYAFGENELMPISRKGHSAGIFGQNTKLGATIVDAMDTLWIMNMTDEFEAGRQWIATNLSLDSVDSDVSVFETVIRFVGGLLSCFALTGDPMFAEKARSIGERLLPAFETESGVPRSLVNPLTGKSQNYGWASGNSILAEFGSLHLEFVYLSHIVNDTRFADRVNRVRQLLYWLPKPYGGLYPYYVNPRNGKFGEERVSIGALGDSFYEYLIKSWIQSGGSDVIGKAMYDQAVDAIDKQLVRVSANSNLTYLASMNYGQLEHKMQHLACFAGGMFAIGSRYEPNDQKKRAHYLKLGADITETCHQTYARTATQIGPEEFYFTDKAEATAIGDSQKHYILRPEVVESYFYMWRLTHDQRYRDYAWAAFRAIETHCRVEFGYSGIANVDQLNGKKDDVQQSYFLAETIKYLYLTFSDDEIMPLDEWVFNTEAHPLPVRGKHASYPIRT